MTDMSRVRLQTAAYPALRVVSGFLFVCHGLQKFGFFGGRVAALTSRAGIAGDIEVVTGALIVLGLFTRPAAFLASGEMAAAYFLAHVPRGTWPLLNGGEPAVLFCFLYLYVSTRGAGPISIDGLRSSARSTSNRRGSS